MDEQLKSNLTSSKHWVRFLYMILFAFFLYIASFFMVILVVVQFVFALLTGAENTKLRVFGRELTLYIHQTLMFLTYNTDFKPFPFADWPGEAATAVVPERDPVHEQEPRQPQSEYQAPQAGPTAPQPEPEAAQTASKVSQPDANPPARYTTAADAEVESPLATDSTEVVAATSVIDIESEEERDKNDITSTDENTGERTEAIDTEDTDEDIAPVAGGNDRKTTRTRKKPE